MSFNSLRTDFNIAAAKMKSSLRKLRMRFHMNFPELVAYGTIERIEAALDKDPRRVHLCGKYPVPTIHFAAGQGRLDVLKALNRRGADVNVIGQGASIGEWARAEKFEDIRFMPTTARQIAQSHVDMFERMIDDTSAEGQKIVKKYTDCVDYLRRWERQVELNKNPIRGFTIG